MTNILVYLEADNVFGLSEFIIQNEFINKYCIYDISLQYIMS